MQMTMQDIALCLGCIPGKTILGGDFAALADKRPGGVRMDSRQVKTGDIFVCIAGNRVDGHDFAPQVAAAGALGIVAERDPFAGQAAPVPVFLVESSVVALGRLAAWHRARTKAEVVGITGTAGKTSVKEVLSATLSVHGATSRNHSNMNNQIGLPLSMLDAGESDAFWVMEAGISANHDMDDLGEILRPDLALILNVGLGHTSGLGDKGVAYYKSRFLAYVPEGGRGLISADYPDLTKESAAHRRDLTYFSTRRCDVDYFASYAGPASAATGRYNVSLRGKRYEMVAPFRGNFGSENVAAITGAAHMLGLCPEEIAIGLAGASLPKQRFCCTSLAFPASGGQGPSAEWTMIDDSYNANPLSTGRMLEAGADMAKELGRKLVLVMGEMLELGREAEQAHYEIGRKMAGASVVFWKGGHASAVERGLGDAGYAGKFAVLSGAGEFAALLDEKLKETPDWFIEGGVALFKGSRGNRLEELAEVFKERFKPG